MKKAGVVAVAGLLLVGLCLVLVFGGGGGGSSEYDACVSRCVSAARQANIDRDDITDEDFGIIMAEHRKYICPGKCER